MAVVVVSCKKTDCDKTGHISPASLESLNEQLSILRGQGVTDMIVAINKMDSAKWS